MEPSACPAASKCEATTDGSHWQEICDDASPRPVDRILFAGRQFLNSYALEWLDKHKALQDAFRAEHNTLLTRKGPS